MVKTNEIVETVKQIFNKHVVYLVGGSVRDELLGKECNDCDFATSLTPDEIEKILRQKSKKPYLIGKKFGTIATKVKSEMIEITTFRTEKYTKGSRKPQVEFVKDIIADLSRRDFTINAMAKRDKKIIDPYGGQEDLKSKIIRAVGNPTTRFREDPLRMLRACRFASQLGFKIEDKTFDRMKKYSYKILEVSKERWMIELDKLLMSDTPGVGLEYLWASNLFKYMIPELHIQDGFDQRTKYHQFTLSMHTILVVEGCPKDITLRWAALLHDIAKPFIFQDKENRYIYPHHETLGAEFVDKIALYLKWSRERRENVKDVVLHHLEDDSPIREYDNAAKL